MTELPIAKLRQLLKDEIRQRREEGFDVGDAAAVLESSAGDRESLLTLHRRLSELPVRRDFPFVEPSDLDSIRAVRPSIGVPTIRPPNLRDFTGKTADRIHGGWLGRCAGCALGKPLENVPFMRSAANVRKYLEIAGAYPLTDFVPQHDQACRAVGLEKLECVASQRGNVRFMESDDDLRYTIMGLDTLERIGPSFGTRDVAKWWLWNLPAARCFTAEEAAYRNLFLLGEVHWPEKLSDADLEFVRAYMNPYREWIGAQIRADGWGLACPGRPELAAVFAWRDASLSHVKNGIYGEMFCAAMIAAALVIDDSVAKPPDQPLAIVRAGLGQIPERSRLADAMRRTVAHCESLRFDAARFEQGIEWIWREFGHYDPVHTINNAAAVVTALLLGGRDYEKVITLAVMAGWDTDCNGATAGCIAGAMLGAKNLPAKWTAPLNDTLLSEIPGFHPIRISELAARHTQVAERLLS